MSPASNPPSGPSSSTLISVIVPAYNYAAYLPDALESVTSQTYSDWECIVVDDGSTDETGALVRRFTRLDRRIRYFRQPNRGLSSARNTGLRFAEGGLIQLLDADDRLEPDKLRFQREWLADHPETDIVYGKASYFASPQPDERLSVPMGRGWMPVSGGGEDLIAALLRRNIMVVSASLTRRQVFDRVGLFDVELRAHEDWEFWLRAALAGCRFDFAVAPSAAALIRVHPDSMSRDQRLMLATDLLVHQRVAPALSNRLAALNHRYAADVAARLAIREALAGDIRSGVPRMIRAALQRPRYRWLVLAAVMPLFPSKLARWVVGRLRPGIVTR